MYSLRRRPVESNISSPADLSAVFQRLEMKTDHHVHFEEETDVLPKDNDIVLKKSGDGALAVHLGFLQIGHRYHIEFTLPQEVLPPSLEHIDEINQCLEAPFSNPHCHLVSFTQSEAGHWQVTAEFFAFKEKLMKEELCILPHRDDNLGSGLKLIFHARVLGKGKGTPLLRNGIHCVGVELEDESEASDWVGFE